MKLDTESLAHTKWNCKYHIVFAPKYRRQVIYDGILYIEGETLETFLKRRNISDTFKYPAITFGFLDDEGYREEEYVWRDSTTRKRINKQKRKNRIAWRRKLDEYIESIPDDTVIIGVDCHV